MEKPTTRGVFPKTAVSVISGKSSSLSSNTSASSSSSTPMDSATHSKMIAGQEWQKAHALLTKKPVLVTPNVLIHALQHQAPLELIQHMLRLNPRAAAVPNNGPTPLQVAVQSFCALQCVETVLRACPLALVAKTPGSHLDPLSYAKRFRGAEKELIRLLSYPVGYWMQQRSTTTTPSPTTASHTAPPRKELKNRANNSSSSTRTPSRFLPYACGHDTTSPSPTPPAVDTVDPKELDNCKLICMAVLKGHRRLSREMLQMQEKMVEVTKNNPNIQELLQSHGTKVMQQVQAQNQKMHRTQMIAIEMKQQAMKSHLCRVENRVVKSLEQYKQETTDDTKERIAVLQCQLSEFSSRMDRMEGRLANPRGSKSKIVMKPRLPPQRILVPNRAVSESFDTCDETEVDGPLPFVFVTPCSGSKHENEDGRSLLTGDNFVERPFRRSKRLLHVLCKNTKN